MARKRKPIAFGKYTLIDRINVGGMAEVFKAIETRYIPNGPFVAIKRILPTMAEDEDFIKMFLDEAKIASHLEHLNVCKIFELGCVDETHFIAMEYIQGKDVLQIQNKFRKNKQIMPVAMAAYIMMRAAEGLDYAHRTTKEDGESLGLIHRDVSPQNVLISYEGEVKVIDFGIAKAQDRQTKTQVGILKGKFGYMSPEQVLGLEIDHRSDLFALGTVLYEMLTGERLFVGESDFSTLEKVRNVDILPPRYFNDRIPERLEQIVIKALSKDRDKRYGWGKEIASELKEFLDSQAPFDYRNLSSWLKSAFTQDITKEKEKNDAFRKGFQEQLVVDPALERTILEDANEKTEILDIGAGFSPEDAMMFDEGDKTEVLDASSLPGALEDSPSATIITPAPGFPSPQQGTPPPKSSPSVPFPATPQAPPSIPFSNQNQFNGAGEYIAKDSLPSNSNQVLNSLEAPSLAASPQSSPSLLKDILIGVSIALVLVCGVLSYFLFFSAETGEETPQSTQIEALAPKGVLSIEMPKGASVSIEKFISPEGKEISNTLGCEPTPCEIRELLPGSYILSVVHPDYEITEAPKVKLNQETSLRVPVSYRPKAPGTIRLASIGKTRYSKLKNSIEIFYDDEILEITNRGEIELPSGTREIEIHRAGFLPLQKEVVVREGEVTDLKLRTSEFTEATIVLRVDSTPVKGKVTIDGKTLGEAPAQRDGLPSSKSYVVVVKAEGYKDFRKVVRWREGPYEVDVLAELEKEEPAGYLVVNTSPLVGMTVYVNGKKTSSKTPVGSPGIKLPVGSHKLTFVSSKGKKYSSPKYVVEINSGETTRKTFEVED